MLMTVDDEVKEMRENEALTGGKNEKAQWENSAMFIEKMRKK